MSTTSDRLGAKTQEVSADLAEMGGIMRDAAQEKLGQLGNSASECYERGQDNVHGVVSTFEQYVRERPVKSVMIAAGIGLLVGRFWLRR